MTRHASHTLIETVDVLDERLTRPSAALRAFIPSVRSPLVVLGAGGKMGPTLCVRAHRAAQAAGHALAVVAVSRFSNPATRQWLEGHGVQTIASDLLQPDALQALPDAQDVVYLVGQKFGTTGNPSLTWALNTLPPVYAATRYRDARFVALSTGNVYPLVSVGGPAPDEDHPLTPLGEYANACVARERLLEHVALQHGTRMAFIRLNYAIDLRYGVLLDLATRIWTGQPIDLTMGYLNVIWQGDANDMILRTLALTDHPPQPFNLTGPDVLSVRTLATRLADLLDRPTDFTGTEADTALLSNPARILSHLGPPPTPLEAMLRWTAHWVRTGGPTLNKPTRFEVRDGRF